MIAQNSLSKEESMTTAKGYNAIMHSFHTDHVIQNKQQKAENINNAYEVIHNLDAQEPEGQ
jgi:hypothetical protein